MPKTRRKFPPRPGFTFPGNPPKEALAYFRAKGFKVGFDYRDVWREEHATAFTVAKAMDMDVLESIRNEVDKALAEGRTFTEFKRDLQPTLERLGWWGRKEMTDPVTGEVREVQLGSPRRLKTIYNANLRTARAAGQWERIQRNKQTHPYLLYRLGPSENHREQHQRWNGLLLPVDDPFWASHFPPNGWNCFPAEMRIRCNARAGLKTWYAGEMVELHTRLGNRLTVTANHPVLTRRGWLPAHQVQEGDQLLSAVGDRDARLSGIVDHEQPPTRADDLFQSLAAQGLRIVPMSPDDFHGDAHLRKPEIEVAGAYGDLMNIVERAASQLDGKVGLDLTLHGAIEPAHIPAGAALAAPVVSDAMLAQNTADRRLGDSEPAGDGGLTGKPGAVQRQHLVFGRIVARVSSLPGSAQQPVGLASALDIDPTMTGGIAASANRNTTAFQNTAQGVPADAQLYGELLEANPGLVAVDEVRLVRKYDWSGHVYDFSTDTGLIVAGGLIVSNCKCWIRQVSRREYERLVGTGRYLTRAPKIKKEKWLNKRTGEIERVPDGIDPGWDTNPGMLSRQARALGTATDKLNATTAPLAVAGVRDLLKTPGFAAWYNQPKPAGNFPVAVLPDEDAKLIGARTHTVLLSGQTSTKQHEAHPDISAEDYIYVQDAIDRGRKIQDSPQSLIYILEDPEGFVVVVKATKTGRAVFLPSFRRLSRDEAKRDKEIQRLLEKEMK